MPEAKKPEHAKGVNVVDAAYIEDKIYPLVAEQLGYDRGRLSGATRFAEDLGFQGTYGDVDKTELIIEIEGAFDMSIPDEDIGKMMTLGNVVDYIHRLANLANPKDDSLEELKRKIATRKKKQKS